MLLTTQVSYYNFLLWGQKVQIIKVISSVMINTMLTSCFPALPILFWTSQFIFFGGFVFVSVFFIPAHTTWMTHFTSASPKIMENLFGNVYFLWWFLADPQSFTLPLQYFDWQIQALLWAFCSFLLKFHRFSIRSSAVAKFSNAVTVSFSVSSMTLSDMKFALYPVARALRLVFRISRWTVVNHPASPLLK